MSGRRVPLSTVANGSNSPYRTTAAGVGTKRGRSQSSIQRELAYGQPPPAKKQMVENDTTTTNNNNNHAPGESVEGKVFTRANANGRLTAFDRRLMASRERSRTQHQHQQQSRQAPRAEKSVENLETIRQWQKHYRKVFPHFIFYFESIPEDVRMKCSKQVTSLGAREEKFFSKNVTHVVTTRPIPPESTVPSTDSTAPLQTINPSLLERSSEAPTTGSTAREAETRRPPPTSDVLVRAREMGMKIWALEKIQRMMTTMFDTDTGYQVTTGPTTRGGSAALAHARQGGLAPGGLARSNREQDLFQLLRNERLHGPTDRDPTVATKEMVHFKGPYIYVRDLDEKVRPIMIREYAKVGRREDGSWPQFRSVREGKCPFVEDHGYEAREKRREKKEVADPVPRTRAAAKAKTQEREKDEDETEPVLAETESKANQGPPTIPNTVSTEPEAGQCVSAPKSKLFEPPMMVPTKRAWDDHAPAKRALQDENSQPTRPPTNQHVGRGGPAARIFAGEPIASGVQQSNVTSAIRSQMVSSTAATAPGAKAGTSKEVFELKRKVLEKRRGANPGSTSSHRRETSALTAGGARSLAQIDETRPPAAAAQKNDPRRMALKSAAAGREKRELKPGYCENCRDKFDDFDEHIACRKHRKFALADGNWAELDALLSQLVRPLKEDFDP